MGAAATLAALAETGVIMISRAPTSEDALRGANLASEAGIRAIEVTFSVPAAVGVITRLRDELPSSALVGAGTVLTREQSRAAIDAGADFIVSPGTDEDIVTRCLAADVLVLPGVLTASEIMRARALGARAVKLFPASTVGPGYLRAMHAPMPDVTIVPSGGISSSNAGEWLRAGAAAVGIGGALSPAGPVDAVAASTISREALACLTAVAEARGIRTDTSRPLQRKGHTT
jgi:2-dehydro-3-deoxyphosphogluconate aldolase/(4S)-4-hydroxy-2-oxoglutarate aldolase